MTGLATSFRDAEESPGLLLWRVTHTWQAAQRAALRPFDLTHVQFVLLASLTWLAVDPERPVSQRDLARHTGTDPMMTSQVLRALEDKGLVERRPHPTDARARSLVPTSAGVQLANRAVVAVEETDARFFGRLADGGAALVPVLRRLLEA